MITGFSLGLASHAWLPMWGVHWGRS